ncbi:alcohol dehydrogenase catalytic domain-containing protein [Bengtsoniella intestinalis]|uniref:zinc-dependent alcohol dehydrogenase n=1 Tax=Bengtsoniella intestinalis TaxID=3073143 RepID=UPI00391F8DD5
MSVEKGLRGRVYEPEKVEFFEFDIPVLKEDEVLIKVKSSAICGSDLHIFKGKHPSAPLPVTIGHEMAGDVVRFGAGVTNLAEGDRVTFEPCIVCGTCDACLHGTYGYCENISYTYRNGEGTMANYVVAKAKYVYQLPDYLTYDTGCLVEPLSVATHAVKRANIRIGETVLIIGAGAIGMMVGAICRKCGAKDVIIADFSDERLAMAKELGATITINSGKIDLEEEIAKLTKGKGVDKSFECVGRESTFLQAMMTLRRNGLATIIGIFENPNITIPASRFVTHEIHVQGAQGYCWDFDDAISIAKEIDMEKFVTHKYPLDQLQQGLETALNPRTGSIKVIINP